MKYQSKTKALIAGKHCESPKKFMQYLKIYIKLIRYAQTELEASEKPKGMNVLPMLQEIKES